MLANQIVMATGSALQVSTYTFKSEEQKDRHRRSAARPSGPVILYELLRILQDVGLQERVELTPRSVFKPEMLVKPLVRYLTSPKLNFDDACLKSAYEKVRRMFRVGELKPLELEKVSYHGNTNSGAPLFCKKVDAYKEAYQNARAIKKGKAPEPLTVFHRGKDLSVARPVFGFPFEMTLIESQFFEPYQTELVKHHTPYVGGQPNTQIASLVNEVRGKSRALMELDYSGFDGSLSVRLISMAFEIIKSNFVLDKQSEKDWNTVTRYFVTAPMLLPDGSMIKGRRHGVPSGSMFTQVIDSICNALIIEYVARRLRVMPTRYYVLGDDSIIGFNSKQDISEWKKVASELGITINLAKSNTYWIQKGVETHFLGHDRSSSLMRRSTLDSVERLLCPERLRNEYFSNDPYVRKAAYVERLKAYQDDNINAWPLFEKAILKIINSSRSQFGHLWFEPSPELDPRMKWDPDLRARARVQGSSMTPRITQCVCKV